MASSYKLIHAFGEDSLMPSWDMIDPDDWCLFRDPGLLDTCTADSEELSLNSFATNKTHRDQSHQTESAPFPCLNSTYIIPTFKYTPIDVVCDIFKYAATADRHTAISLLRVSKAIHNLLLPILYDSVYLLPGHHGPRFASTSLNLHPIRGCKRPVIRYLNTVAATLGPAWRQLAYGRPETEHVCLSMMDLHAMASLDKQLQPLHVGIVVDGIHHFPHYVNDPLPRSLPRSTRVTIPPVLVCPPSPSTSPSPFDPHKRFPFAIPFGRLHDLRYPYSRHEDPPSRSVPLRPPHASFFMWTTHLYFVDNMPPHIDNLRPYLPRLTHFAFAYRRDHGLQIAALATVLHEILAVPSVELVLVLVVRKSRTAWAADEKELLRFRIPASLDPRVVFCDEWDDLHGLTWDADEPAIWRLAEERRMLG